MRLHLLLLSCPLWCLLACGPDDGEDVETDADADTDADSDTDAPIAWARVDDGGVPAAGADIAVTPDGAVLVSWVDVRGGDADIWLRVAANGAEFDTATKVSGDERPIVDWWTGPALTTDGHTVLLSSPARHDGGIRGLTWQAPLDTREFGEPTSHGAGTVELIHAAISPSGEVWVGWLDYSSGGVDVMVSNPTVGAAGAPIQGPLGSPSCECCAVELFFTGDARPLAAWRDNDRNIRDIAVAAGEPGASTYFTAVRASDTHWQINACPVQGPRLAELTGGGLLLAWSDSSSGLPRIYTSLSADAVSWSTSTQPVPGDGQVSPRVAVSPNGQVFIAYSDGGSYYLTVGGADGAEFADAALIETPVGPAEKAELAAGPERVWLVAEADGQVWVKGLE